MDIMGFGWTIPLRRAYRVVVRRLEMNRSVTRGRSLTLLVLKSGVWEIHGNLGTHIYYLGDDGNCLG